MHRLERAGFPMVLEVHDEMLAEVKAELFDDAETFRELMCTPEPFMRGLPVAANVWSGSQYQK
jgi:hypothetical protein